jgi:AraC family transcriptional activator of mtrCDE
MTMTTISARDALSDIAPLLRVVPEIQDFCRFGGTWAAEHGRAVSGSAHFHIVTRGRCVVARTGNELFELNEGDALILPFGDSHAVRSRGRAPQGSTSFQVEYANAIRRKSTEASGVDTELICGELHFEAAAQSLMASVLPEVIVLRAGSSMALERYRALMAAIHNELEGQRPGALAIATNLASALFVMMLRTYLEDIQATRNGLVGLLADRVTTKAVQAMVRDPARPWALDELASLAATSRATLVRAFRKTSGFAPLAFLSELRLGLVRQRLQAGRDPLAKIAIEVGFQSEASMSRAYHRRYGVRPGASRRGTAPSAR